MWRKKAIKWTWVILVLNAAVALLNLGFTYGHWVKHEYWTMCFSMCLVILNSSVAVWEYQRIKQMNQDLKRITWQILQGEI